MKPNTRWAKARRPGSESPPEIPRSLTSLFHPPTPPQGKKAELREFIVSLSKEFSILSQFTSFVAIEERVCNLRSADWLGLPPPNVLSSFVRAQPRNKASRIFQG